MTRGGWGFVGLLAVVLLVSACAEPIQQLPAGQAQREILPLADLHFHPKRQFSPEQVLRDMDQAGVRWAGNGAIGDDDVWDAFARVAPERLLPFAGQGPISALVLDQGEAAWSLKSPEIGRYLETLEQGLRAGRVRGIGELFVNNVKTAARGSRGGRYPADSPLMQRLLGLAAAYQVPLSVHMDAEPASVAELERLLALDRKGLVIWAHCGFWAEASLVRRLMAEHANLLCELSYRDDRLRHLGRFSPVVPITGSQRRLKAEWKALLEEHSDRFLIGTDTASFGDYHDIVRFYRTVLDQLSAGPARRIAHENARRILRLGSP